MAPASYFNKSMLYLEAKLQSVHIVYLIFTDDVQWSVDNVMSLRPNNSVLVSNFTDNYLTDFYLLTRCNHVIMSVGTFGWWGAYLAGGLTTYYGEHGKPNSRYRAQYNDDDLFPPSWVKL